MSDDLEKHVNEASVLLTEMGSEVRLRILKLLVSKEFDVRTLAAAVDLSQSALSQHLTRLKDAKLVTARVDRQNRIYSCKSQAVAKVLAALKEIDGKL